MSEKLQAVKGMNDLLPPESAKWQHVERLARRLLEAYGYREVRTPLVEPTQLFARAIGAATDIVEKEMYTFADGDPGKERLITLRPEGTAGAVRALLEHGVVTSDPTSRWYYSGPMFRRERQQKGRYRQFYQIGAEAFGVAEPSLDAEMIGMLVALFEQLGIKDVDVLVNSVGGEADRPAYRAALLGYLEASGADGRPRKDTLCENCKRRMVTNPLRILDCKVPGDVEVAAGAPSILDSLSEASRAHFAAVRAGLEALAVKHTVDPRLVRGLDYYTGTVFEVRGRGPELGSQNALCGGGRYDKLVEQLGGPAVPAVGFAFGVERVVACTPGEAASYQHGPELALVSHGARARAFCLTLAHRLRAGGARVDLDHRDVSLKAQLKRADRIGAKRCGVVGDDELLAGTIMLKDMQTGEQRQVSPDELARALEK